jgi:hypothetical protein
VPAGRADHVGAVLEPPEPDREAADLGTVPQEVEARVGVAGEGHGPGQAGQDLRIRRVPDAPAEGGQLPPDPIGVRGLDAAVEAEQLPLRHVQVLPPGLGPVRRRGQPGVRLQAERVRAISLGGGARDGFALEAALELEERVARDTERHAVALHLEASEGHAGLAQHVHLAVPPALGSGEPDREPAGALGHLEDAFPLPLERRPVHGANEGQARGQRAEEVSQAPATVRPKGSHGRSGLVARARALPGC